MRTFWLVCDVDLERSTTISRTDSTGYDLSEEQDEETDIKTTNSQGASPMLGPRSQKLIEWNVEQFSQCLKKILVQRASTGRVASKASEVSRSFRELALGANPVDQVAEIIEMPESKPVANAQTVELDKTVTTELRDYITYIASTYSDDNAFHNFEHVRILCTKELCHLTLSCFKHRPRM